MLFSLNCPFGLRSAIRSRDSSSHLCPLHGRYNSAPHGALTQFSTFPVHPACCGATHAVAFPFFSCAVSSIAMPGPVRPPSRSASPPPPSPPSSAPSSFQPHTHDLTRPCIRPHPSSPPAAAG